MTRKILPLALLLSAGIAHADDPVDKSTPVLEWAYQGAALADMATTLDIKNHPTLIEENPLIGSHPSDGRVLGYFAITGGLHYLITRELVNGSMPRPLINAWEVVSASVEVGMAAHNYSIGLRFRL